MKAFLSSTYVDLRDHRRAAAEALERLGHRIIKMETFGSRPEEPQTACLREVEASDYMVGIYAHRYGFIPAGRAVSITEEEFEHARRTSKPVFCFSVNDDYPWPPKHVEGEPGRTKLLDFKQKIGNLLIRDTFSTPDDLAYRVATAVGRYATQERVSSLSGQLKTTLGKAALNPRSLTQGRTLSDVPEGARNRVMWLLEELRSSVADLPAAAGAHPMVEPDTLLALAQGLMAEQKWLEAARRCEEYARIKPQDWEANYLRGVAFANARAGPEKNLASLRAYNDAIAFLPPSTEPNVRARLFAYRGAMHKRLGRLEEAEADLMIAQRHASRRYEVDDVTYNLAGVFALQGNRDKLLAAVGQLSKESRHMMAIRGHLDDYFQAFRQDEAFLRMIAEPVAEPKSRRSRKSSS